jgi:glyoxylase-like metal-dependent hydrolase (beta-lactamase superfamily II)
MANAAYADPARRAIIGRRQPRESRERRRMQIRGFFDKTTSTLSYVLYDEATRDAVVLDPVLDLDPVTGLATTSSLDALLAFVRAQRLRVHLILETHAHADHLSGAQLLRGALPDARIAIAARIVEVQAVFRSIYGLGASLPADGSQFDRLLRDGERVAAGSLAIDVLATPGHTPACLSFRCDDAVFTGDTLFMPDSGTGRCDFPGGDAGTLYDSIQQRLYRLPDATRTFTGHDYQPGGRALRYEATIGAQKRDNIQLAAATDRADFVAFRQSRDATLAMPRLFHPALQVNIDGGRLPASGFLRVPVRLEPGSVTGASGAPAPKEAFRAG